MGREKIYSIQYLRGIAAVIVAYVHGVILQIGCGTESFQQQFHYMVGASGVDLFFTISGFVMCYVSREDAGLNDLIQYIKKKFVRINIVYYFTALIMISCLAVLSPAEITLESVVKTLTILPIFDSGDEFTYPMLYVAWTLSYDWFFYVLYGVFILLSIVTRREIYLISIIFVLFLIGFFFPVREIHYIFVTNPMFLEFAGGMAIAVIYRNIKKIHISIPAVLGMLALVAFSYLLYNGIGQVGEAYLINNGIYTWHRVLILGIPSALLLMSVLFWEKKTSFGFYKSEKLKFLGDASYSIFLTHPILYFLISRIPNDKLSLINPDLLIILIVIIAVSFGIAYHKFVEKRLISIFNGLLLGKK